MEKARTFLLAHGIDPPPPRPEPITALPVSRKVAELAVVCYCGGPARLERNAVRYAPFREGHGMDLHAVVCLLRLSRRPPRRPTARYPGRRHHHAAPTTAPSAGRSAPAGRHLPPAQGGTPLGVRLAGPHPGPHGQDCHIGAMDATACRRALELIAANPYGWH
jgi:hypothetical protein